MTLRHVATAIALMTVLTATEARAESVAPMGKTFGVGLQLGAPTSATGKFMLTGDQGIVLGIGAGIGWDVSLSLHADYLWHPTTLVTIPPALFSWYIGGGGWLSLFPPGTRGFYIGPSYYPGSPLGAGVRVPIGVDMAMRQIPLEMYLEGVPMIGLFPWIGFGIGVALGARLWF